MTLVIAMSIYFAGMMIVMNTSSTLLSMMLIAINRFLLIIKSRSLYNKIYTKQNTAFSIVIVSLISHVPSWV